MGNTASFLCKMSGHGKSQCLVMGMVDFEATFDVISLQSFWVCTIIGRIGKTFGFCSNCNSMHFKSTQQIWFCWHCDGDRCLFMAGGIFGDTTSSIIYRESVLTGSNFGSVFSCTFLTPLCCFAGTLPPTAADFRLYRLIKYTDFHRNKVNTMIEDTEIAYSDTDRYGA